MKRIHQEIQKRMMTEKEYEEFQKIKKEKLERHKKLLKDAKASRRTYGERLRYKGQIVER